MALNANALVTLEQVKDHLDMLDTIVKYDTALEVFINAASQKIETYCNRRFKANDYIQHFRADRTGILEAREFPVLSIDEVMVDSSKEFTDSNKILMPEEYFISEDKCFIIIDSQKKFIGGQGRIIRAKFRAGYVEVPADIVLAALWTVEWLNNSRTNSDIGRNSVSKGDETVTYESVLPRRVYDLIADYKRTELAVSDVEYPS